MINSADLTAVTDRLAIIELVNRHVDDVDGKRWDAVGSFYTDDAVVRWSPEKRLQGRSTIVDAMRQRLDTDEVVTYHFVASFSLNIDGDTAEAPIRIRAMHEGVGPRTGRFYESFGVQKSRFVRTQDGWRCNYYEWEIPVERGNIDVFTPHDCG
jgi:ketosteroid isomerase-like protein